jgi:hypothetical protein
MEHLPTIADGRRERKPHRLPLDERMRRMLVRKLERGRSARQTVDHAIDLELPVGTPSPEPQETLQMSDAAKRAAQAALRRTGDPTARRLRQRLGSSRRSHGYHGEVGQSGQRARKGEAAASATEAPGTNGAEQSTPAQAGGKVVRAGDPLAERARKLKRQRKSRTQ